LKNSIFNWIKKPGFYNLISTKTENDGKASVTNSGPKDQNLQISHHSEHGENSAT
jgi:hypothetical protein